jgi:O-antigen/teichoic acid export membrane protein
MMKHRLYIGGAWALSLRIGAVIVALCTNALLTRLLTPQEAGTYFLITSLASVAALTAQLGLGATAVRMIAEEVSLGREGRVCSIITQIGWYGGLSISVMTLGIISGLGRWLADTVFDAPLMGEVSGLFALWVAAIATIGLLTEIFRGFHHIPYATFFGNFLTGFVCLILFTLLWVGKGSASLEGILWLNLVSWLVSISLAWMLLRQKMVRRTTEEHVPGQTLLHIAWPLWISSLTILMLKQVDLWVVATYLSEEKVALYAAAARLVALVELPLVLMNTVIPPFITSLYVQGNKKTLENMLRATATLSSLPAIVIALVFWFFGETLLTFVYGSFYHEGYMVLSILTLGYVVNVFTGPCGFALMMTCHQRTFMTVSLFTSVLTIIGTMSVVQQFGLIGIAFIMTIMISLQNVFILIYTRRKLELWTHVTFDLHDVKYMLLGK